jgi:hypothetical protein
MRAFMFLAIILYAAPASVFGQSRATLRGPVTDNAGGAVPGVIVQIRHVRDAAPRVVVTSPTGDYAFEIATSRSPLMSFCTLRSMRMSP